MSDRQSSWWPQLQRWDNSRINVRAWTSACETWFQNRLSGLTNGDTKYSVRGAGQWRQALTLFKHTNRLIDRNERNSHVLLLSL